MLRKTVFIVLFACAGCNFHAPFLYEPDITQGNVFRPEQVNAIVEGMPRAQVRHILGTPTIADPFHPEIDSYVFVHRSGWQKRSYRKSLKILYNSENLVIAKEETPIDIEDK